MSIVRIQEPIACCPNPNEDAASTESSSCIISNPKNNNDRDARARWFPYYAGFSTEFVSNIIQQFGSKSDCRVLDPWNGAGTTTQVAASIGLYACGADINPIMGVIAKARQISGAELVEARGDLLRILVGSQLIDSGVDKGDPLLAWFCRRSVSGIRNLSRAIANYYNTGSLRYDCDVNELPVKYCFFMLVLFASVNQVCGKIKCTNPTWRRLAPDQRVGFSVQQIIARFQLVAGDFIVGSTGSNVRQSYADLQRSEFLTCNAACTGLPSASFDLVVGSPPYCTRIDYAVTTAIESAIMFELDVASDRVIRNSYTGTSTIRADHKSYLIPAELLECNRLLTQIRDHQSYASKSYYYKTYLQYFYDLLGAVRELARVVKSGGDVCLVVQDSYYKELRVDLAEIVREFGQSCGLMHVGSFDFPVRRNISRLNSNSPATKGRFGRVETVLMFKR